VWSIEGDRQAVVSVRRLSAADTSNADAVAGETWEVVLPSPQAAPFVLLATRESTLRDDTPVALASMIDADNQHGVVHVRSIGSLRPEVRSRRRLTSIPLALPPADQYPTALAAFRYNPEEQAALSADAPLVLVPQSGAALLPKAWIWEAHLESRFGRNGAEHALTCRLENAGLSRLRFQPPPGVHLRAAMVNDQSAIDSTSGVNDPWRITLPAGARFATLVLRWSEDVGTHNSISAETAPWPGCDVPILSRQWTVSLPLGTAIAEAEIANSHVADVSWTRRLFGPLARSADKLQQKIALIPTATGEEDQIATTSDAKSTTFSANIPASVSTRSPAQILSAVGWTNYRFTGLGDSPARIWIVDERSISAQAWSLFVLTLAARWWIGRRSISFNIGTMGLATAAALLISTAWIPFTSAIWLGLCAGTLLVWALPKLPERIVASQLSSSETPTTSRFVSAATGACFVLFLVCQSFVLAQESADTPPQLARPASEVFQVLIPIDKNRQPTGGLYHLPVAFYDELLRRTDTESPAPPKYLITQAKYRGAIVGNAGSIDFAGSDWRGEFEIESMSDRAVVRLPLGGDGTALVPDGVQVDGRPQPFRWDEASGRLEVELHRSGAHQLHVEFRTLPERHGYDFAVPVVNGSQIEATHSASLLFEINSLLNDRENTSSPAPADNVFAGTNKSMASVGPATRLVIRPPAAVTPSPANTSVF
ncbi:MAG TPA: hypothetical protein VGJ15_08515, partial [Pirellulales bacterium]